MRSKIRSYFTNIEVTFNGLNKPIKILVSIGSLFVIFLIWQQFVSSLFFSSNIYSQKISILEKEIKVLSQLADQMKKQKPVDLIGNLSKEKETLIKKHFLLEKELSKYHASLVTDSEVSKIVKKVIHETQGVELTTVTNLPKKKIIDINEGTLYRNPYQITLIGDYNSIYNYLLAIEAVDLNLHWDNMMYVVSTYPEAVVKLDFHVITINRKGAR